MRFIGCKERVVKGIADEYSISVDPSDRPLNYLSDIILTLEDSPSNRLKRFF